MKETNSMTQRRSKSAIAEKSSFFFNAVLMLRSRRESNPHLRFRKPPFYPLNYGNNDIFDFRFSIADCKQQKPPTNSCLDSFAPTHSPLTLSGLTIYPA